MFDLCSSNYYDEEPVTGNKASMITSGFVIQTEYGAKLCYTDDKGEFQEEEFTKYPADREDIDQSLLDDILKCIEISNEKDF